ncbi:MAG: PIN domain-containing protein [Gemmatimonadetes bacterium]|nr:PIN domain-containing protein [Gemmatimonadota bacterium]
MATGAAGAELAAVKTWIVDTGPLVAYLDARDPVHATVAQRWDGFTGHLATTSAVITEGMHFVAELREGPLHLAALVADSGMEVYDLTQPPELHEAARLMEKYADTPMDFADATLVLLAEALGIDDVFTLDYRGFSVYRTRQGRALRPVLAAPC